MIGILLQMTTLVILVLLLSSVTYAQVLIRENVVFQKVNSMAGIRSTWTIALEVDLDLNEAILNQIMNKLGNLKTRIYEIWRENRGSSYRQSVERIDDILSRINLEVKNANQRKCI